MILVVDDEKAITSALKTVLTSEGFEVCTAAHGGEAYDILKKNDCDCVLLDVNMPEINGIELLILLQAEGIHVPTIVMATFGDFSEMEMKQFESVVAYLPKPFEMSQMVEKIRDCIAQHE